MNKQMENIYFKVLDLPHLRASINFADLSKLTLTGAEIHGYAYTVVSHRDENGFMEVSVFYTDIEKSLKRIHCMPMVFHEIIHALQYICENRGIDMAEEKENIAYLGSYIVEQLLDLTPPKLAINNKTLN